MRLDITISKGEENRPAVILIHGLGMDKNFWVDPLNTRIFARNIPLKAFAAIKPQPCLSQSTKKISIGEIPKKINNLWSALRDEGFNIICWSQRRPVGPISIAVEELADIIGKTKRFFPGRPIALIGHSRGGLIARKFMERKRPEVKALITISTPHAGSAIARLGKYLKPLSAVLKGIFPKDAHGTISRVIKNVTELLEGNALKELLPDSGFLKNLKDSFQKGVRYMSLGGTKPRLIAIYAWERRRKNMHLKTLMSIPDSLLKISPPFLVVDEITPGKGDGLVTAKSSLLPWTSRHYNLGANHVSITWDRRTISNTIEVLKTI